MRAKTLGQEIAGCALAIAGAILMVLVFIAAGGGR